MKSSGLRWLIATLMFAETLLGTWTSRNLSVLAPLLGKEIGMTTSQYAFVTQGFLDRVYDQLSVGRRRNRQVGCSLGAGTISLDVVSRQCVARPSQYA
jgi:hypothetical protein